MAQSQSRDAPDTKLAGLVAALRSHGDIRDAEIGISGITIIFHVDCGEYNHLPADVVNTLSSFGVDVYPDRDGSGKYYAIPSGDIDKV